MRILLRSAKGYYAGPDQWSSTTKDGLNFGTCAAAAVHFACYSLAPVDELVMDLSPETGTHKLDVVLVLPKNGGATGIRTPDLRAASASLS